jgi:hypothetical protein
MEKNIYEDWYSVVIDKEKIDYDKLSELLFLKTEKNINDKINKLETSILSHINYEFKLLHHIIEKKDFDNKKIQELLYELKNYKEREINIMIREKIPFPFYLDTNTPLQNSFKRIPFSHKKL